MDVALLWTPLVVPTVLAAAALPRRGAAWSRYTPAVASLVTLVCGLALVAVVRSDGPLEAAAGLLRADALSAYLVAVVGAVALTATWAGLTPRAEANPDGWFAALLCLFLGAMTLALLADNVGILWVAVEATTIATAFLVGHRGGRHALEAAWKYVVLGSVGVAIAFLGVVLLYAATTAGGSPTLSWVRLLGSASTLDPNLVRIGAALAALGFATKAGLAPMHSWLPDAHSQAPAAVSGLMSGVLLSVAFYAILRVKTITDAVLGPDLMRGMLVAAGLLSLLVAAALMLTQRDYKRLLAYSSIEHMGILALGAAVGGPIATGAVLVHILGHGLAKAAMFVVAGRILSAFGSSRITDVRSLLARHPRLAVPFLAGMTALLGFPPFGLFFTEVALVLAGIQRGLGWAMAVTVLLL
ncbi:MAG TPA: proton-conducting transporter membrane subunit, partial [Candidatus Lustribacter sp.]|nr:proton-conducting transporter membrane subunit [Candidatus Lustribacter sp.]